MLFKRFQFQSTILALNELHEGYITCRNARMLQTPVDVDANFTDAISFTDLERNSIFSGSKAHLALTNYPLTFEVYILLSFSSTD